MCRNVPFRVSVKWVGFGIALSLGLVVTGLAAPRNLLPNASFELGFGEGLPTHWSDYQNRLTLRLTATEQVPEQDATVQPQVGAPDGRNVAVIPVAPNAPGHLPSPVVAIRPGQAYTVSVYARSNVSSARLQLTFWTHSMDFESGPDGFSEEMELTREWKRYVFHCLSEDLMSEAVVDLVATTDRPGEVWVDAVQLEEGNRVSPFETRYPLEAIVYGKRPRVGLHLMDEPLVIYCSLYNRTAETLREPLEVKIESLFGGKPLSSHKLAEAITPGTREYEVTIEPTPVGRFRARLFNAEGKDIGADDYPFLVHPVMEEDFQGVLYSIDGRVGQVPAERVTLDWTNHKNWYADPGHFAVTDEGKIYLRLSDGRVAKTEDGGRSWEILDAPLVGNGLSTTLRDGTWLSSAWERGNQQMVLYSSTDEGQNWQIVGTIPGVTSGPQAGPITELADGTLLWPIHFETENLGGPCFCYRSTDRGKTWSRPYILAPGGEPHIMERESGKLLAVTRHNPRITLEYLDLPLRNYTAWRFWQRHRSGRDLSSYVKRVLVADSEDGGTTWTGTRPGTLMLDEMHGSAVELPDGRIVLHHTHRFPTQRGGEWCRISRDGGFTWDNITYYLSATPAYPGYGSMCVLPPHLADGKPGMILALVGERCDRYWSSTDSRKQYVKAPADAQYQPRMQAVRWRPLPLEQE